MTETTKNDHSASLIHQPIPDVEGTEPRLGIDTEALRAALKWYDEHAQVGSSSINCALDNERARSIHRITLVQAINLIDLYQRPSDPAETEPRPSTLEPCPFCGKDAAPGKTTYAETSDVAKMNGQNVFHFIQCMWCGANNQALIGYKSIDRAIRHWNLRQVGSPSGPVGYHGTSLLSEASGSAQSEALKSNSQSDARAEGREP